ncbi:MAG: 30S ribosomal protein S12 methylthiotransferase RimO [Methylohalobius sp.]|nr:30S ribosomal protein S12 methylthiotransferase RimO [Methylohalobius sp.]
MKNPTPRIGFVSLGCPKALVDSERILTRLRAEGYAIAPSYEGADLVVVNTCGFIEEAVAESLEAIDEALAENGKVIVTGCLGARPETITSRFPSVLEVTGARNYEDVVAAVHRHLPPLHDPLLNLIPPAGIKLTPRHYAYLKIAEGCNHRCTFCIIPSLRGPLVSRPIREVLTEAERLVQAGVKEILVIAQDTSAYGADLRHREEAWRGIKWRTHVTDLARGLGGLDVWVRLHYVYPYPHVDELIPLMAEGKILPYLDVPLQHASARILKLMRRPANADNTLARIQSWRAICPDLVLRSTFIVGFPGETEAEFEELLEFLRDAQLDRVGAFKYSPIEGAAANALPDSVPEEVKEERLARFMEVQAAISAAKLKRRIGRIETVLVDKINEGQVIARSYGDAPEIDGVVYLEEARGICPGQFVNVKITGADTHDLWAVPVD